MHSLVESKWKKEIIIKWQTKYVWMYDIFIFKAFDLYCSSQIFLQWFIHSHYLSIKWHNFDFKYSNHIYFKTCSLQLTVVFDFLFLYHEYIYTFYNHHTDDIEIVIFRIFFGMETFVIAVKKWKDDLMMAVRFWIFCTFRILMENLISDSYLFK